MIERTILFDTGWFNGYRDLYANDRLTAKRVRAAVNALARDPEPPGNVHLTGSSFQRLNIGNYRVLYEVTDNTIRVWSLGHTPD
ncbi:MULTISPECIES: type II toxin-antitoxin system RelE family toxin [unclassified Kribbella]|uniref:type II toxin-antitoxin system RelE family toxin n=1 Tax=unclassified Kribbella TaxID=2644121 RepID=UPI003019A6AB